jgi:HK97 family phage portal protein
MKVLDRVVSLFRSKAVEGAYRPGPWLTDTGWLPQQWGQYWNWWQLGYDPLPTWQTAMVEACVSAYAQTVAMCPYNHWREREDGGRSRVATSALSRIMRAPNDYQTISDFLLNLVRSLYLDGNAYALALRNDRFEISSLHLMHPRHSRAQVFNGEIYYELGGNRVIDSRMGLVGDSMTLRVVPARDVLHVKLHVCNDILHGETPLMSAAMAIASSNAILAQSINFFQNQSRPSGILQTDLELTAAQVDEARARWEKVTKGQNAGGTPILTHGLKFTPVTVSAKDGQIAELMKLNDQQIAEVFRIPLAIIGSEAQPMGSTEALMNFWVANGLGFALNQVELAFDKTFALAPGDYSELDTSILLRSAFRDRIEGLARAVQGGIYAPNEARKLEGLSAAKDGNEPRVQQQVVPLSFATAPPPPPAAPKPPTDGASEAEAA